MIAKEISSLQHPLVKHWMRLRTSSSYRRSENALLVTGKNVFSELALSHPFNRILIQKGSILPFDYPCNNQFIVSAEILKKITGLLHPEPLAAELPLPPFAELTHAERVLVIDQVRDPSNLGALLRSALAFGWDGVFIMEGSADPFNDKALRASKGAIFRLPLAMGDIYSFQNLLLRKPWSVYGASMEGPSIEDDIDRLLPPLMLILGNEAKGLSAFSRENSTLLSLPMSGAMESLNVAIAGSLMMYLLRKK